MSVAGTLLHFGLNQLFDVSTKEIVDWVESRFADSSRRPIHAVITAHGRAWQVVGLALSEETFAGKLRNTVRDGDLKAARLKILDVIAATPNGLGVSGVLLYQRAAAELLTLRGRTFANVALEDAASSLRRFSDPAALCEELLQSSANVAIELTDAPHLAAILQLAPDRVGLFESMCRHFFRALVAKDDDLSRRLTHDQLRALTAAVDTRTSGILDQFDVLFDALDAINANIKDIRAKLDRLLDERNVSTRASDPLRVSVTNEKELNQLRKWRDELRKIPPELLESADWSKLGDALAAARLLSEAQEAHAAAAKAAASLAVQAEAEFKVYRDACEREAWDDALAALTRAADLDADRFAPFPLKRYEPVAILGAGGFGTVIRCKQRLAKNREVAVKTFHSADLGRDLDEVFAEAHRLSELADPGIIKVLHWEFADPAESRPYLVMEYFPGVSLAAHLKRERGPVPLADFLPIARHVAATMAQAHASNVLHRDLKPGNVLVLRTESGWDIRIIDFGLAVRFAAVQASVSTSLPLRTRRDHSFAGTLEYASPEQKGLIHTPIGPQSDVYSFGKTMLEALVGTTDPVTDDWDVVPEACRESLKRLLEKCIIRDPARRHSGFAPVVQALAELLSGKSGEQAPAASAATKASVTTVPTPQLDAPGDFQKVPWTTQLINEIVRRVNESKLSPTFESMKIVFDQIVQEDAKYPPTDSTWDDDNSYNRWGALYIEMTYSANGKSKFFQRVLNQLKLTASIAAPPTPPSSETPAKKLSRYKAEAEPVRSEKEEAERKQREEAELTRRVEAEQQMRQDAERKRLTEDEARKKDPFHPGKIRPAGEKVRMKLPGDVPITFAWCPPGTFRMGSEHPEAAEDERPVHSVRLSQGFFMGIHPVTRGQFARFVEATGYKTEAETGGGGDRRDVQKNEWVLDASTSWRNPGFKQNDDHPVTVVSWNDAQAFAAWLQKLSKRVVRLPTEAEWEYACRAGTTSEYWSGNDEAALKRVGWYRGPSKGQTQPVGKLEKNVWGLFDMHGNVWDWCEDWFGLYTAEDQTDPCRTTKYVDDTGQEGGRVLRGGCWGNSPDWCRATVRCGCSPAARDSSNGFRVCFRLD